MGKAVMFPILKFFVTRKETGRGSTKGEDYRKGEKEGRRGQGDFSGRR